MFNEGKPVYVIERINTTTGKPFGDEEHILYVNGAYVGDSDIGKLMHDFRCNNADDMYFDILADITRYYKKTEEGVSYMCKMMEDRVRETEFLKSVQIATNLLTLGVLSNENIAKATGLTLEQVQELAEKNNLIPAH